MFSDQSSWILANIGTLMKHPTPPHTHPPEEYPTPSPNGDTDNGVKPSSQSSHIVMFPDMALLSITVYLRYITS